MAGKTVTWLATALALAASPAAALEGKLTDTKVETANVPHAVDVTIYTPPGYDPARKEPYPLIVQLHGGGGSNKMMGHMAELLEKAIALKLVPPAVSVMPSAARSFYMDYRDGSQKWESFVVKDLIAYMRANYDVAKGREGTLITGISMGGMGSLRMAFKYPDVFQAVASQEPGIEPALAFDQIELRDRFWRSDELMEQIYGKPIDKDYWAANNPATIASRDPNRLLGLEIYLEAGDQDMFFLQHGTEFVHRVLFDAGIGHEYRLVRGAEHVGPSVDVRFLDAMGFFGRVLDPPAWINGQVEATRKYIDGVKTQAGYPVNPPDPRRVRSQ